jgi:hypothetical protein
MSDTIIEHALTKQDVRALQHADSICFDHTGVGTGRIRAIRRAENSSTGFEETHYIEAHHSSVTTYGIGAENYTAFSMFQSAKYSDMARTIVRHLREGSRFSLEWIADNSSPITKGAGLVRDELRIRVQGKNAKVADVFLIDVFIGYDNTARMVRKA